MLKPSQQTTVKMKVEINRIQDTYICKKAGVKKNIDLQSCISCGGVQRSCVQGVDSKLLILYSCILVFIRAETAIMNNLSNGYDAHYFDKLCTFKGLLNYCFLQNFMR